MKTESRQIIAMLAAIMFLTWPLAGQDDEKEDENEYDAKFANTALELVMNEYGTLTGRTPLIAPGVNASITLKSQTPLTKQEYLDAIESVLAMNGIALIPEGEKFVRVVLAGDVRKYPIPTLKDVNPDQRISDAPISQVIILKNMEVEEARKIVDEIKSKNGVIHNLPRVNGMLVTDAASNVKRILEILEHIDQPIEVREKFFVIPVRNVKASEIKSKLEEIIADLKDKPGAATPTIARAADSGAPRVVAPPGVIRAPRFTPPDSGSPAAPGAGADGAEVERGIVRGKVKIVADDRTGLLIFITLESNMKFFEDVVSALDITTAPDVIVRVFRLEYADAESIANMLNSLIGAQKKEAAAPKTGAEKGAEGDVAKSAALQDYVGLRPSGEEGKAGKSKIGQLSAENIKILPDKRTNGLIVMGSKSDIATIEEIVRDMDMMLSQVLIEVAIIDIRLTDGLETGVDWLQRSMVKYGKTKSGGKVPEFAFTDRGGGGLLTPVDATGNPGFPSGGGLTAFLTHFGLNVDLAVRLASSDDRANVVSTPVILTTDNTEAKITATETIYVYNGKKYDQHGNVFDDYQTKELGLELTVKPHINTNKVVMMEIKQSMSEPDQVGAPESGRRVSSSRTLNASVSIRDRDTIVLGGQVRDSWHSGRSKIPFLGDIPLAGRLFNSTTMNKSRSQLIVLITPYVLDTPSAIKLETARRAESIKAARVWNRGWSESKIAKPSRAQARKERREAEEQARAEKEAREQAGRLNAAKAQSDARKVSGRTERKTAPQPEKVVEPEPRDEDQDDVGPEPADDTGENPDAEDISDDGESPVESSVEPVPDSAEPVSESIEAPEPGPAPVPGESTPEREPAVKPDPAMQRLLRKQGVKWGNSFEKVDKAAANRE